jgi:hypothetical protein
LKPAANTALKHSKESGTRFWKGNSLNSDGNFHHSGLQAGMLYDMIDDNLQWKGCFG